MMVSFHDIELAAQRIRGGIYESPCPPSIPLSLIAGCEIFCKLDYLQRTGSFKERGARNALLTLTPQQRRRGVVAASAGNHAQGLAYHGKLLDVPVTVVMPRFAPLTKVNSCQQLGARVLLHGEYFDEARLQAEELAQRENLTYIHPFNNETVIAGQGTMGLEIIQQVPDMDAVLVPVGGGGLLAGVSLAVKQLRPQALVIGVEPQRAACVQAALEKDQPTTIEAAPTLADGLAVTRAGDIPLQIIRRCVDRMVSVSERSIALAVLRIMELEKGVVEGAGAVGLAACLSGELPELAGKRVVLLLTGGNIDTPVLGRIIERGLAADGRLCRFVAKVSDRPGGLAKLASIVAAQGASIKDIEHDRVFAGDDLGSVNVHCVVETRDFAHRDQLRDSLIDAGFSVTFADLER